MSRWKKIWFSLGAGWLGFVLSGCAPAATGPAADQREVHFVLGENRISAGDYAGAIQAFEQSLEVDPRSASAHFELGWLYDRTTAEPSRAIYHYEQYLKLDPNAGNAAIVKQRIDACKQKLAEHVLSLPATLVAQQQVEQLIVANRQLALEIQELQADSNRWSLYCARRAGEQTCRPPSVANAPAIPAAISRADRFANSAWDPTADRRMHVVAAGETAFRIAHRSGVSLAALLAANPGLDPRRMIVGTVLKIPERKTSPRFLAGNVANSRMHEELASREERRGD